MVGVDNVFGLSKGFGAENFIIFCGVLNHYDIAESVSNEKVFGDSNWNFAKNCKSFLSGLTMFGNVADHVIGRKTIVPIFFTELGGGKANIETVFIDSVFYVQFPGTATVVTRVSALI